MRLIEHNYGGTQCHHFDVKLKKKKNKQISHDHLIQMKA